MLRIRQIMTGMAIAIPMMIAIVCNAASAGDLRVLHSFSYSDGENPSRPLRDSSGELYGTTSQGGPDGYGTVYKLSPDGSYTVLYAFTGDKDGGEPVAGLTGDKNGNFYGVTYYGGGSCDCGVIFKIAPDGAETVLHTFAKSEGAHPETVLVQDSKGNLYGTTHEGGANNFGVIFKLSRNGAYTVLHDFMGGSDGAIPWDLQMDEAGTLYGVANFGGANRSGVLFSTTKDGGFTVLYNFRKRQGRNPDAGPIEDSAGNLYGTTIHGGNKYCDCGLVYRLAPDGTYTVLNVFGGGNGAYPWGGLYLSKSGKLYGVTQSGGADNYNSGTVFELALDGSETILHTFTAGDDGYFPQTGLIDGGNGSLVGATCCGGANFGGTLFAIDRK